MIRLLCVEDDPIVGEYLSQRLALEPDFRVVGTARDVRGALAHLCHEEVDLVLLDYQLEGADGIKFVDLMSQWYGWPTATDNRPWVLFCTGHADAPFEAKAREIGASGVVAKERITHDLIPAVRAVTEGGTWFRGGY